MSSNPTFTVCCLLSAIASTIALAPLTNENHPQYIQEIIIQHEIEMKHAERINIKHDLPVVSATAIFVSFRVSIIPKLISPN